MIHALMTGELQSDPTERTSASGKNFVTAPLRVPTGESAMFVGVTAFDSTARDKLMTLRKGDAVAVTGVMSLRTWTARDGTERTGWGVVAGQVMTVYGAAKRRKAAAADDAQTETSDQGGRHERRALPEGSPEWLDA